MINASEGTRSIHCHQQRSDCQTCRVCHKHLSSLVQTQKVNEHLLPYYFFRVHAVKGKIDSFKAEQTRLQAYKIDWLDNHQNVTHSSPLRLANSNRGVSPNSLTFFWEVLVSICNRLKGVIGDECCSSSSTLASSFFSTVCMKFSKHLQTPFPAECQSCFEGITKWAQQKSCAHICEVAKGERCLAILSLSSLEGSVVSSGAYLEKGGIGSCWETKW